MRQDEPWKNRFQAEIGSRALLGAGAHTQAGSRHRPQQVSGPRRPPTRSRSPAYSVPISPRCGPDLGGMGALPLPAPAPPSRQLRRSEGHACSSAHLHRLPRAPGAQLEPDRAPPPSTTLRPAGRPTVQAGRPHPGHYGSDGQSPADRHALAQRGHVCAWSSTRLPATPSRDSMPPAAPRCGAAHCV